MGYIAKGTKLDFETHVKMLRQLADGMEYIHKELTAALGTDFDFTPQEGGGGRFITMVKEQERFVYVEYAIDAFGDKGELQVIVGGRVYTNGAKALTHAVNYLRGRKSKPKAEARS